MSFYSYMPEPPEVPEEQVMCDCCGGEVYDNDGYWHEAFKDDLCNECFYKETNHCQICGEDAMPSHTSEFIVVKVELANTADRVPGIYRIMGRPFLSIPLVGSGSINEKEILFIDKLPKGDGHYDISGHICKECAEPYEKIYRQVYKPIPEIVALIKRERHFCGCRGDQAKWEAFLTSPFSHGTLDLIGWNIERHHTLNTIKANPDMLRDLECDKREIEIETIGETPGWRKVGSDQIWKDLLKQYRWMPNDVSTYHEQLFLEHKGIKVYRQSIQTGEYFCTTMALRPEPAFREDRLNTPLIFSACGLPLATRTWRRCHRTNSKYWDYNKEKICRRAIIDAIDKGRLTAKGFLRRGKLVVVR